MRKYLAAAALLLAACDISWAQQEIEWKQTLNMPKGQSLPRDRADILGIELGDSYAEAKAKLEKLAADGTLQNAPVSFEDRLRAENAGSRVLRPLREEKRVFRMQVPGASTVITASFVAKLVMERKLPGKASRTYNDNVSVYLSAPSSGHQVIGIERVISYNSESDQPRVSELLAQLKEKLKAEPGVDQISTQSFFRFVYNDGRPATPRSRNVADCSYWHSVSDFEGVRQINPAGDCDAMMYVKVSYGISRDHTKHIEFVLSDNDRTKANLSADFAFIRDYIRSYQERTRGAPPKL